MYKAHTIFSLGILVIGVFVIVLLFIFGFRQSAVGAVDFVGDLHGWAWSSNVGWISFNCGDVTGGCIAPYAPYGVRIEQDGSLSGYAWSSNIGWIDFAPAGQYPAEPEHNAKLDRDTGDITGWARVLSLVDAPGKGWMSLSGQAENGDSYGVSFDESGNISNSSFSWEPDVVGWVGWSGEGVDGWDGVTLEPIESTEPPPFVPPDGENGDGSGDGSGDGGGIDWGKIKFFLKEILPF